MAQRIAKALRIRLVSKEEERLNKTPTRSLNAYTLYLMGQSYRQKSTKEGIDLSIEYFRKALEIDPRFALAYVGMATSFENLGMTNYLPGREAFPKARELVTKAIELDEELADGHCILAEIMFQYDWNWSGAKEELRRSLSLNPNLARAHMSYAFLLLLMGRQEEPLVEAARAQELDPNSASIQEAASFVPYMLRLYDLSMEKSLKLLETDPNHPAGHTNLGLDLLMKKKFDESIEELRKAVTFSKESVFAKSNLGYAYAVSGNKREANKILEELVKSPNIQQISSDLIAQIFVGLGEESRAIDWLEKAYEERSSYLPWIKVDPIYDGLHSNPRFVTLLKKMGIEGQRS